MTRPIAGLREIADRYDGYIVDLWGVMHDGVKAFPEAVDCLQQLKSRGARIVMLSNAPRRSAVAATRSITVGVTPDLYDAIVTSGEDCWLSLEQAPPGKRALFIAASWDADYLDGLDIEGVDDPADADFVLALGVERATSDLAPFESLLQAAQRRDLFMLCANPDLVVIHDGKLELCAGAVARRYEEIGGRVRYHGKPHDNVYRRAFEALGPSIRKDRILAIGDSLRTDVAGARASGTASAFVSDGIHWEELAEALGRDPDPAKVAAHLATGTPRPDWVLRRFAW